MDLLRRYLIQSSEIGEDAGADVVETLVERLQTATRTEDRRDSMRGIKALSKRYRLEVGTQAMPACIEALSRDCEDTDTVSYALDTLCNIMSDTRNDMEPQELVNIPPDLGKQFTEIFVKDPENVQLVLSFISAYDMHLRRQTIKLLIVMLQNNRRTVQDLLLNSPLAVPNFMATLSDPMEVIRNDGLLLLLQFTKKHTTIQKIVAFENVFERVLSIVEAETVMDGGVVVEDCFNLLHQLLAANQQNQMLFKDGRFVQRLTRLFEQIPQDLEEATTWSAQKLVNVSCLLKIFRVLVSARNKTTSVRSCQEEMRSCGLLSLLWQVVMAGGVPAELLTETLYTLGETVQGCAASQAAIVALTAPSEPPLPAINVLLATMVNDRQQLAVRLAVLYCFQCLLADNHEIQANVVATLLPKNTEPSSGMSAGQLLCGGLFSQDGLTAWFSAIALFHAIHRNHALKESLLQVHMAPSSGSGEPVTLLQQCFRLICQSGRVQGKIGLLQFLCAWLSHCPRAVEAFLSLRPTSGNSSSQSGASGAAGGAALSHLIADVLVGGDCGANAGSGGGSSEGGEGEIVSSLSALLIGICVCYNNGAVEDYDSASLMKSIDKRIGIDDLVKRIGQIYLSDEFVRVIKNPVLEASRPSDLVFDYDFTQLFRIVEFEVCTRLSGSPDQQPDTGSAKESEEDAEVRQRAQMQQELLLAYQRAVAERDTALQNLQLRVIELERQLACAHQNGVPSTGDISANSGNPGLEMMLAQKSERLEAAEKRIAELEEVLKAANAEKESIKAEHEDLLLLLSDQDSQIKRLTEEMEKMSTQTPQVYQPLLQAQPQRAPQTPTSNAGQMQQQPPQTPISNADRMQQQQQQSFSQAQAYLLSPPTAPSTTFH